MNADDDGTMIGQNHGGGGESYPGDTPWCKPDVIARLLSTGEAALLHRAFRWTFTAEGYAYWSRLAYAGTLSAAELEKARLAYARVLLLAG